MAVCWPPIGRAQQPVASALPRESDPLRQEREPLKAAPAADVPLALLTHRRPGENFRASDTRKRQKRVPTHLLFSAPPLLPLLLLLHKCLYSPALLFTARDCRSGPGAACVS